MLPNPCLGYPVYSNLNPTFNSVKKENRLFNLTNVTFLFNYPVAMLKETKKIEEVDSKSEVVTPQYHIIREPPDGRPEFLVIEIDLPGIVSTYFCNMINMSQLNFFKNC